MLIQTLKTRREKLAKLTDKPVFITAGKRPSRNFPANKYPFRASSHFLYFAGIAIESAVIQLNNGKLTLYVDNPHSGSALWHGESPTRDDLATTIGADYTHPLSELPHVITNQFDTEIANAIVTLRLQHDEYAISEIRNAVEVTTRSHIAGMKATRQAKTEAEVRSAMESLILSHNMTTAYNSIVTVHGEVLHNEHYHHPIQPTDLILADVGAETQNGWAADVTRTWNASGKFSSTQRELYNVVLAAHDVAIAAIKPGVEYKDLHLLACLKLAEGFIDLGILKGNAQTLVDRDAHALFFPHGVGHLLGLDVHDMEDLGDAAGYANGRTRSDRFGLGFLRLDRPLQTGMVVTIEPGFYQVPAILNDPKNREKYNDVVNWKCLEQFNDVRGIRIEDDVLVTDRSFEVLTQDIPVTIDQLESLVND
jgi:Xaa-Pro aminopeptidase